MAGNITGTVAANIGATMTYAAKEMLPILEANLGLARFVRRYTDEVPGVKYSAVPVPAAGRLSAVDKAAGTAVTFQNDEGTEATVTLNKHKVVPIRIEDFARAISNPDIMAGYVQSAYEAIARQFEADVIAAGVAGFTNTVGTYGTDLDQADLAACAKTLFDNYAPLANRIAVISSKDDKALRADTTLASYFAFSDPNAVREGRVARIEGFDILPSQLVPVTAGTPNQTNNLALHRDAIWIASRAMAEVQDNGVVVETVTDPATNLSFRLMVSYDHSHLAHILTVDALYGVSAVRPELGVLLKS